MRFEFATATRVVFGAGSVREFKPEQFGRKAFIVTGRSADRVAPLLDMLKQAGVAFAAYAVEGEPTVDSVSRAVVQARGGDSDFVIGFGGGSAIDAGKAIAALLANQGELLEYLEVIGDARPLPR